MLIKLKDRKKNIQCNTMKKITTIIAMVSIAVFTSGCAGIISRPFPGMNSRLEIGVTDKRPGFHDLPDGIYEIPKTNLCVANVQGNEATASPIVPLLGITGLAIAAGDLRGDAQKKVQGTEANLSLNLQSIVHQCLETELAKSQVADRFSCNENWRDDPVQITPYAALSFVDDEKARLWVVLRVELIDNNFNQKDWYCRYIVGLGQPHPISGDDGWASNHGQLLEKTLVGDTQLALHVMVDDLRGKVRVEKPAKEKITGRWIFYNYPHEAEVQILKSTDDWDMVLPLVGDNEYFAGINILPKNFSFLQPVPEK